MIQTAHTPVDYIKVRLPQKPRLAPWVNLIHLGDNRLQFRGAEYSFTLRNQVFLEAFEAIRPLLDGNHSAEEIAASGGTKFLPTTITLLLKILKGNGLLQEGKITSFSTLYAGAQAKYSQQFQFFSHFASDPEEVLELLVHSRVALVGAKQLRALIQSSLASVGIHQILELNDLPLEKEEVEVENLNAFSLEDVDFLIACQESPSFLFFEKVNKICLETKTSWLRVVVEGATALLGPTVVPYQSACYLCYDRRVASNISDLDDYLEYRDQVKYRHNIPNEGSLSPLLSILAHQAALEVARISSAFSPPQTIGRFYELKATSPTVVGHDVLRLPRCSACHDRKPKQEAWDSTPVLKSRKS